MVKDAEANASADKEKRSLIESRNKAEALAHEAEKNLREHGDKVSESEKSKIEADVKAVRDVLESTNKTDIDAKAQALSESMMKLGEAIYKAQQTTDESAASAAAQADAGVPPNAGPDGEVVDAQFEDVSDDKKKD
jgi:molecular chaperone DnaK